MKESRDESGRFTPEHTDDEVLAAVRAHEPAATSEVADELDISRQGADHRLRRLRDEGRVTSKKIGASLVWFTPNGDGAPEDADEHTTPRGGQQHAEDAPAPEPDPPTGDVHNTGDSDVPDALAGIEFPGGRARDECVAAVYAARDYLREHGQASMRELVVGVMPEHPVGYDAEKDVARINDPDARNRSTWWRKAVRPGLEALDDVEKPPQGASEWEYTGDGAEPNADEPPTPGDVYDPTEEF
jgi:DNA-binding Lrp family transcriptional regulator